MVLAGAAAPAPRRESAGVGPAALDDLPVAAPAGSAFVGLQLGVNHVPIRCSRLEAHPTFGGEHPKTSWVWTVLHELVLLVNGNNVSCSACKKLLQQWKRGSGTSDLSKPYETCGTNIVVAEHNAVK